MERGRHRLVRNRNRGVAETDDLDDLIDQSLAPVRAPAPLRLTSVARSISSEISDRRRWAPAGRAVAPREPARDVLGRPARVKVEPKTVAKAVEPARNRKFAPSYVARTFEAAVYTAPRSVKVCIDRKVRREVLFANKKWKKASRKKRWSETSNVHCR